jgi:hypothetical protein
VLAYKIVRWLKYYKLNYNTRYTLNGFDKPQKVFIWVLKCCFI